MLADLLASPVVLQEKFSILPWLLGVSLGLVLPVALVVGMVKCILLARRPRTSTKSAVALAVALGAPVMLVVLGWLAVGAGMRPYDAGKAFAYLFLPLLGCSAVLGILGVVESRKRSELYDRGRGLGIAAIVLSVVWPVVLIVGVLIAANREGADSSEQPGAGNLESPIRFEALNFQIRAQPGWRQLDTKKINPEAVFAMRRRWPEIWFLVIAERLGVESGHGLEALLEISRDNLRSADTKARLSAAAREMHPFLDGRHYTARINYSRTDLAYGVWLYASNGFCYQCLAWGKQRNKPQVEAALRAFVSDFELLDQQRRAYGTAVQQVSSHRSDEFGYELKGLETGWYTSEDLADSYTEDDLAICFDAELWLSVLPVYLGEHDPSEEAVLTALMEIKGYDYPKQPLHDVARRAEGDEQRIRFRYEFVGEGNVRYVKHATLVRKPGFVYLIEGGYEKGDERLLPRLEHAVAQFATRAADSKPEFLDLPERAKRWHAWFFNAVANHYYCRSAFDSAHRYYETTLILQPKSKLYVSNTSQALLKLSRHRDALLLLNRHGEVVEQDLDLRGDRAWLLSYVGQIPEALAEYASAFAGGLRDVEDLECYVDLLSENNRAQDAITLVTDYRESGDAPRLVEIHANLLVANGKHAEAIALLDGQPKPLSSSLRQSLIRAYQGAGRLEEALAEIDGQIRDGYRSAQILDTKIGLELRLGRLDAAGRTLDDARLHHPKDPRFGKRREQLDQARAAKSEKREKK